VDHLGTVLAPLGYVLVDTNTRSPAAELGAGAALEGADRAARVDALTITSGSTRYGAEVIRDSP
jgi:hypothetical protein